MGSPRMADALLFESSAVKRGGIVSVGLPSDSR